MVFQVQWFLTKSLTSIYQAREKNQNGITNDSHSDDSVTWKCVRWDSLQTWMDSMCAIMEKFSMSCKHTKWCEKVIIDGEEFRFSDWHFKFAHRWFGSARRPNVLASHDVNTSNLHNLKISHVIYNFAVVAKHTQHAIFIILNASWITTHARAHTHTHVPVNPHLFPCVLVSLLLGGHTHCVRHFFQEFSIHLFIAMLFCFNRGMTRRWLHAILLQTDWFGRTGMTVIEKAIVNEL